MSSELVHRDSLLDVTIIWPALHRHKHPFLRDHQYIPTRLHVSITQQQWTETASDVGGREGRFGLLFHRQGNTGAILESQ